MLPTIIPSEASHLKLRKETMVRFDDKQGVRQASYPFGSWYVQKGNRILRGVPAALDFFRLGLVPVDLAVVNPVISMKNNNQNGFIASEQCN